jgi:hypothetical protein
MTKDDVSQRQQFRINAMHGHDVGVWVCEGSGMSLSPVLFMQAVCPDPAPRPLLVKWKHATVPPKAFRKDEALPLVYSECGRLPLWPYYVHLFAPQVPVARAMEQSSGLQDWSLSVPVVGIVLIFNQKYDRPPSAWSFSRLMRRSPSPDPKEPLTWVQEQQAPYIVAALGYDETTTSVEEFRQRYHLTADIPVMAGPKLADTRRRTASSDSGIFSSFFEPQKLGIDRDYARAVLGALFQRVERER